MDTQKIIQSKLQERHVRVLVLGRSPEVMEHVLAQLAELGVDAVGTVRPEEAPSEFDVRHVTLAALGGGVGGLQGQAIRRAFQARHPGIRILDVHAPTAALAIRDTLRGIVPPKLVDLDAYCARIGYDGPRTPTLETLQALQRLHPAAIPFEAIDVLLDRGISLAPGDVDAKLIHRRRGGYCFEHNSLFRRVLLAMGFEVEGLLGRVVWMAPPDAPRHARTHMLLRVTLGGVRWLADVGFGVCVPTSPLRIDVSEPQPTAHEPFRIFPFGTGWLVQARLGERWTGTYEVFNDPMEMVDYEPGNWFTSTHPSSLFRQSLNVARATDDARYSLRDNRLTVRRPDGSMERNQLDPDALERVLAETFTLPVEADWRPVIERAVATGEASD